MILLAIDPGETTGYVVLEWPSHKAARPYIIDAWQAKVKDLDRALWATQFHRILRHHKPDMVVIEDYRVYAGKAGMHIGQRLFTAELIGAIEVLCAICIPPVTTDRLPAAKKGRWPDARIDNKFPQGTPYIHSGHESDALKLGLAWLEKEELWTP